MLYSEKATVENFIINELQKLGWTYMDSEETKSRRRANFEEPLMVDDLRDALKRTNASVQLVDPDLDFIVTSLRTTPATLEGIRTILDRFRNGLVVPVQKEHKERIIKLVDIENIEKNNFVVTNQFKIEGLTGNIRADVVLLVNGIPLVLIECKNPTAEEVDWTDAYKQIKRYEDQAPDLFKYVQFSIATDGIKSRYFPNAFNEEGKDFLGTWKDPFPFNLGDMKDDSLKTSIYGLLSKPNLLDLVGNFVFVRKERDRSTKVMARYMQFRAANRIFYRVLGTLTGKEDKKFGLIWHWQGSGKTYSMAFSAWKLLNCPKTERPSVFVLVDRKDLEEQIEKDFSFIEIPIEKVGSIKDLIEILRWGGEGKRGIFLVTIEKFSPKEFLQLEEEGDKIQIGRENVIVFADEVHRTQYKKFAALMRSVFKNAFIFGFTGTPLSKIDRNTFQKFSPTEELYLDRYSMLDALEDGVTVSLSYQSRLPKYHLDQQLMKEFVKYEEEEIQTLSSAEQKELSRKIQVARSIIKKPDRVGAIAEDVARHFRDVVEPTGLGAMIVTVDREACVLYKNALDNLLPQSQSEIVMTFSPNDPPLTRKYLKNLQEKYDSGNVKEIHEKIIDKFKAGKEPRILIVTDMLITGFDAPALWTMYLDKPLKEHRILQAIARTNRPFQNKKFGLICDYIGVLNELQDAFQKFEAGDAGALKVVIRDLEKEKQTFTSLIGEALKIFEGVKRENTHENLNRVLDLLIDPDRARKFESTIRDLMRSYEMLQGDPFLVPYLLDYSWLVKVYVAYYRKFKKERVDELKIEYLSKKTVKLIQQTIDVESIDDAYPIVNVDEKFMEGLKRAPPKTTGAAIDIIANVQHEVRVHPTSPFFLNLSKEVEATYDSLRKKGIEMKEAVLRLTSISERITQWKKEEEEIGSDKYPVYEAIKAVLPEMDKRMITRFIDRLMASLQSRKLVFGGWQMQRDVRRKVKAETRLLLLSEFKDHRDKIDESTDHVFEALEATR